MAHSTERVSQQIWHVNSDRPQWQPELKGHTQAWNSSNSIQKESFLYEKTTCEVELEHELGCFCGKCQTIERFVICFLEIYEGLRYRWVTDRLMCASCRIDRTMPSTGVENDGTMMGQWELLLQLGSGMEQCKLTSTVLYKWGTSMA